MLILPRYGQPAHRAGSDESRRAPRGVDAKTGTKCRDAASGQRYVWSDGPLAMSVAGRSGVSLPFGRQAHDPLVLGRRYRTRGPRV